MPALEVVGRVVGDDAVPGMMARAVATGRIVLAVWAESEPSRVLGRFHATRAGAREHRRHTGGRVVLVEPGDVRMALAMPHRSAIVSADPFALRPEQTMNRCVRGLMDACRTLGADVLYPGQDAVTTRGVPIAWLSFAEVAHGGGIFEAGLSLPDGLDVPAAEAVETVTDAYRAREWDAVGDLGRADLPDTDPPDLAWGIPPEADLFGEVPTMLGALGAHVGVDERRHLTAVRLSGDVIAPVETMRAMEDALLHVPALRSELARAVEAVLVDDHRWVLGIDGPRDVAAAVMEALA